MLCKININTNFIGKNIIYKPICASTNSLCFNIISSKKNKKKNIIITDYQYKGRGQVFNYWISKQYKNLTFSLILFPLFLKTIKSFYLNMITINCIKKIFKIYNFKKTKWPNDLYYKRKKISGILIENQVILKNIKRSILGVGININQKNRRNISLIKIFKKKITITIILKKILKVFKKNENYLYKNNFFNFRKKNVKNLYYINKNIIYKKYNYFFKKKIMSINYIGKLKT